MPKNSRTTTFPEWVNAVAKSAENQIVRDSERCFESFSEFLNKTKPEYGWKYTSEGVYAEKIKNMRSREEINSLYLRDMARSIEAYSVHTLWRTNELMEGILALLFQKSILGPVILSRSLLELCVTFIINGVSIRFYVQDLAKHWDDKIVASQQLEELLNKAIFGSRRVPDEHHLHQTNVRAMDGPQLINQQHADFQNAGGSSKAIFFNRLPGRPLLVLHHRAGLCTADSRKTHASNSTRYVCTHTWKMRGEIYFLLNRDL
jgi:hypothetical protein